MLITVRFRILGLETDLFNSFYNVMMGKYRKSTDN